MFNIVIMRFLQPSYFLDTYNNSSTHYCLLKCVYQLVRLSGRVRMCKGYPFYPPFLKCSDLNLNFFRRCDTCFNFTPFFGDGKTNQIKRNICCLPKEKGGMRMVNIKKKFRVKSMNKIITSDPDNWNAIGKCWLTSLDDKFA